MEEQPQDDNGGEAKGEAVATKDGSSISGARHNRSSSMLASQYSVAV